MLLQARIDGRKLNDVPSEVLRQAKEYALIDRRISYLTNSTEKEVRERRKAFEYRSGLQTR